MTWVGRSEENEPEQPMSNDLERLQNLYGLCLLKGIDDADFPLSTT